MRVKRVLAAVLAAALAASLTLLPAAAAPGSFTDISDPDTAVNADILRLMGIISGVGDNRFDPDGTLTRAQFCTMAVNFLQKGDETARYATRTIFSDVGSSHWARSYINFAAAYTISSGTGEDAVSIPLVAGVGNGKFMPDSSITMAEAVTILLRALGYSEKQAGSVWPQGYMDLAGSVGLIDGLPGEAGAVISRAQAARLFVNALKSSTAGGEVYYKSLGTRIEKAIILEVNARTDDGSAQGALRTVIDAAVQSYLPAHGDGNPTSLLGRRGELVLNARDEIVTFLPDSSTRLTAVLDGDARSSSFKAEDGRQYTIPKDVPVYVADSDEDSGYQASQSYEQVYKDMVSGTQVTMYAENGKVATLFASIPGTAISADAVVVMGSPSAAAFHQLTGGVTSFSLRRGKETIRMSDLKEYDVVTYDKTANTLIVSDLRLPCVYTSASPSSRNPETIQVLGNEFKVLESAWDTTSRFKPGDSVVLLLTADGKVAGMIPADNKLRSSAVGVVSGGGVEVFLPNGRTMKLEGTLSGGGNTEGFLVTVSATKTGLSVSRMTGRKASGDYQVSARTLGGYTVASDVRIYEQAGTTAMAPVDVKELTAGSIPAGKIAAYRLNSSDIVDFIVLEDVTGNAYQYGMMVGVTTSEERTEDDTTTTVTHTSWQLMRSGGALEFSQATGYTGRSGEMVGVVTGTDRSGDNTIQTIKKLTAVTGVKSGDFFTSQDLQYVTVSGRTYQVASNVECLRSGGNRLDQSYWLTGTGEERLTAIKGYSDTFTLYVDPVGEQVRVIAAD